MGLVSCASLSGARVASSSSAIFVACCRMSEEDVDVAERRARHVKMKWGNPKSLAVNCRTLAHDPCRCRKGDEQARCGRRSSTYSFHTHPPHIITRLGVLHLSPADQANTLKSSTWQRHDYSQLHVLASQRCSHGTSLRGALYRLCER